MGLEAESSSDDIIPGVLRLLLYQQQLFWDTPTQETLKKMMEWSGAFNFREMI